MTSHPTPPPTAPRIAVFGSANMDLVAYVPTAPRLGETVTGSAFRTVPGGKGANQAVAAARAGGAVTMIGAVGADAFGPQLRTSLAESGVDTSGLRTCDEASGIAHIVVDGQGSNSIIVVPGANGTVTGLSAGDEQRLAATDLLLLQLEIPLPGVLAAARAARAHGVRVVLTPAPAQPLPAEILAATDLLVPNEHEAAALTGRSDPAEAAAELLTTVPEVVVTLGAAGSLYATRGAEPVYVPARKVTAEDTTAAGDTFVGALAVAAGEGRTMPAALAWASAASALSVQRRGASAAMPHREEIDASTATPASATPAETD
ncbi:ribokinase [Streptomyces oceani]|uniref:Ribokinase n=1 Tax=Streptomyces oceani TaxID=1075402 RepID=A0A1E7JZ84_9ACTN|nr:ribokinase [Streptomyces oceani]OEU97013.1 ribokinase [Streptomyces oceani]